MGDASDDDAAAEPMHLAYAAVEEAGAPDSGPMAGDGDGDAAVAHVPEPQGLDWLEDLPTQGPALAVEQDEPVEGAAGALVAAHTAPVDAPVSGDARAPAPAPGAGGSHLQQGDGAQEGVPLGAGVSFPPQRSERSLRMQTAYDLP